MQMPALVSLIQITIPREAVLKVTKVFSVMTVRMATPELATTNAKLAQI